MENLVKYGGFCGKTRHANKQIHKKNCLETFRSQF